MAQIKWLSLIQLHHMKISELLLERRIKSWQIDPVEIRRGKLLLMSQCKKGLLAALANGGLLWRGGIWTDSREMYIADSSQGIRTSRDTTNVYQVMIDGSPNLKEYPKRQNSFICSSHRGSANSYGDPMIIVPVDGTKVAVSSNTDFIKHRIKLPFSIYTPSLTGFDATVFRILRRLHGRGLNNIRSLSQACHIVSKDPQDFLTQWYLNFETDSEELNKLDQKNPFPEIVKLIMTEENLGLKLQTFGEEISNRVECWFSGRAYIIEPFLFGKIVLDLKNSGAQIHERVLHSLDYELERAEAHRARLEILRREAEKYIQRTTKVIRTKEE